MQSTFLFIKFHSFIFNIIVLKYLGIIGYEYNYILIYILFRNEEIGKLD